MSFEFTQDDLTKAEERKVFNKGVAGRAKNVKVTMADERTTKTNDRAPDFKVYFEDPDGNKANRACFSIKAEDYPNAWGMTFKDAMKKEWSFLNKIVEHTGGTPIMSFKDDTDLYVKVKDAIGDGLINVFANYGSPRSPKERIEIRKWLPAVEPASTADADTKLKPTSADQMKEIVQDVPSAEEAEDTMFDM